MSRPAQSDVGRRAWAGYWWTVGAWLVALLLYVALRRTVENNLVWAAVVALPLFAAGVNLVLFNRTHEEICAQEVARHRWLRIITMGGYSSQTFLITGLIAIASSLALAVLVASGR
jgi:hypothetical protein